MPSPLSIAFWAMSAVKKYHTAPIFERPFRLRKVYLARVCCYTFLGATTAVTVFFKKPKNLIEDDYKSILGN